MDKTKVRYVVKYNGRNYEHPLHSNKRYFIRNIADVVNILEYCVTQDLKNDLYKPSDKLYNFNVSRLVNDVKEDTDEAAVVAAMRERFDAPEGAVERDVARVLAELRKIGALEEEAP